MRVRQKNVFKKKHVIYYIGWSLEYFMFKHIVLLRIDCDIVEIIEIGS